MSGGRRSLKDIPEFEEEENGDQGDNTGTLMDYNTELNRLEQSSQ